VARDEVGVFLGRGRGEKRGQHFIPIFVITFFSDIRVLI
tara:strand:- start:346 stop:462 length:117 start_codon:yes stop_codon:yes gene_type:complete